MMATKTKVITKYPATKWGWRPFRFLLVSLFLIHLKHLGRFKSINTVSFVGFFWDSFGLRLGFCWCCLTFCWLTDDDT